MIGCRSLWCRKCEESSGPDVFGSGNYTIQQIPGEKRISEHEEEIIWWVEFSSCHLRYADFL